MAVPVLSYNPQKPTWAVLLQGPPRGKNTSPEPASSSSVCPNHAFPLPTLLDVSYSASPNILLNAGYAELKSL